MSVLRRRLPGDLQGQGREDHLRRRARRSRQPQPPVREGPVRLRLRPSPASSDQAAGPSGQRRQGVPTTRSIRPTPGRISARQPGRRRWIAPPTGSKTIRDTRGRKALAGFGSAKGSNEEAYLFQKLVRTGFGSNNVDHCTRLCHASSVAALMEGLNSGAVSAPFEAALDAEVIIVIGANPTINHPVAATFIKNAVKQKGAKLIVIDPRRQALSRHAYKHLVVQARLRRVAAERHAERDHHREAVRRGLHRGLHREFRGAEGEYRPVHSRAHGRRCAASTHTRCARWRGCTHAPAPPSSSGAWASASTCTAPTMRAA